MTDESLADSITAVEEEYDADIFIYSAGIDNESFGKLAAAVASVRPESARKNGLLILTTNGGLANNAYQIGRLMQQTYDQFILCTPSYCKSAGTIVALGAHSLIMDVFSELGPLDVQLLDKDEIGARKSGLLTRSTFESLTEEAFSLFSHNMLSIKAASNNLVSFKLAADIASRLTVDLMSPIFGQINPDVVGSDYRDLSVATEYGNRLARISKNPKNDTVHRLVTNYPSHDFIIDREEAETLFENVNPPEESLYNFLTHDKIRAIVYGQASPGIVVACPSTVKKPKIAEDEINAKPNPKNKTKSGLDKSRESNRKRNSEQRKKPKIAPVRKKSGDADKPE